MTDSLFSKQNVKFGLYVGVVAGILAFLSFIPCLGFILSIVSWVVLLVAGYMTVVIKGGSKDKIADVIKNAVTLSLIPAAIVAIAGALSGVVGTLVFYPRVTFLDIGPTIADYMITGGFGFVGGAITVVFMFVFGAILAAYYPETKLPAGSRDMLNKFKAMVMN
jgi:hypothetical protein